MICILQQILARWCQKFVKSWISAFFSGACANVLREFCRLVTTGQSVDSSTANFVYEGYRKQSKTFIQSGGSKERFTLILCAFLARAPLHCACSVLVTVWVHTEVWKIGSDFVWFTLCAIKFVIWWAWQFVSSVCSNNGRTKIDCSTVAIGYWNHCNIYVMCCSKCWIELWILRLM